MENKKTAIMAIVVLAVVVFFTQSCSKEGNVAKHYHFYQQNTDVSGKKEGDCLTGMAIHASKEDGVLNGKVVWESPNSGNNTLLVTVTDTFYNVKFSEELSTKETRLGEYSFSASAGNTPLNISAVAYSSPSASVKNLPCGQVNGIVY